MKRSGFRTRERRPAKQIDYTPRPRSAAVAICDQSARMVVQMPKCQPARHEGYRRLVAAMPCIRCGAVGRSQAAHANAGKGMAIKADDREAFPLCGPAFADPGCHARLDQGALYPKAERREHEERWAAQTRAAIRAAGLWPRDLEPWPEDEATPA